MLYFLEVDDENMLKKVFHLRYKIGCEELGLFDKSKFKDELETDEYDRYSDHFAAVDRNCEVVATVRYIHHSPIGYPTPNQLKIYPQIKKKIESLESYKVAEVSRVFIDKKYRTMSGTKYIMEHLVKRLIYFKMKDYGVEVNYGAVEERFRRLMHIYKIYYKIAGDLQDSYGVLRYPALLYTKDVEEHNPYLKELYKRKRWFLKE